MSFRRSGKSGKGEAIAQACVEAPELVPDVLGGATGDHVNYRRTGGLRPLHLLCATHDMPDIVTALLDAGAEVDAQNDELESALMLAARRNAVGSVQVLLAAGATKGLVDLKGLNAAQQAAELGHGEVVALIEAE